MKKQVLILSIFGCIFLYGSSAQGEDISSCGTNCTYTIENGVLTIKPIDATKEASISYYARYGYSTTTNYAPWRFDTSITKVVIEPGITSVGDHSFEDMHFVTGIELPEGLKYIGHEAFHGTALTKVDLPSTLTFIGTYAFSISSLKEINGLPDGLTSINSYAFSNTQIKDLVIPDGITSISEYAFGFSGSGWNRALIENLYCEESIADQCAAAVQWRTNNGATVNVISYQKTADGRIFCNNRWYDNANNILTNNHIKKRIYTVEEAVKISKDTGNTIKLRYK